MKAFSLLQPWATLHVRGLKIFETRSYNTKFRGEVLIHASLGKQFARDFALQPYFKEAIGGLQASYALPLGAIVGIVTITATHPTWQINDFVQNWHSPLTQFSDAHEVKDWKQELAFGDFGIGRWAWQTKNHIEFKTPIPCKGALSFWELPKELEGKVLEQIELAKKTDRPSDFLTGRKEVVNG